MAEHRRVVVVGGGAVGNSVLYGLAKRGCTDAVLLEKGRLTSGSTWMAAGLLPSYARSRTVSKVINKSIEIYSRLEAESGQPVGLHMCGQMRIARTPGRLDEYRSYMDIAEAIDATAELLSPEQVLEKWPLLENTENILGALYHPNEGHISPTDVTMSLARAAQLLGATIREGVAVKGLRRLEDGRWSISTSQGEFTCDHVVLATGLHARTTAARLGMDLPAFPLCVQYWITETMPEIVARRNGNRPEFPIVRDELFDGYTREEGEAMMFGCYERPENLELFHPEGLDPSYENQLLPPNMPAHEEFLSIAVEAIPALARTGIRSNTRGAMQMTPDGLPLVGPAWGVENVWLAEGVPGGVLWGGGIGHALSGWIVDGAPPLDMAELDPRRFTAHATPVWAKAKVIETWGLHAKPNIPGEEHPAGRPGRTTPGYGTLIENGAVMGANAGWEMPLWYAPKGVEAVDDISFRQSRHGVYVGEEVAAVRNGVGLVQLSQMAKYEISGTGATSYLDRLLCGKLPLVGRCCQAYQLFPEGGVAANYTVARLDENHYYLIAVPRVERMNFDLLVRELPKDGSVHLRNTTQERGILTVAGPEARKVLEKIAETGLSNETLPWKGLAQANVGIAPDVRILRISCTGELAFELHHPIGYEKALLQSLLDIGRPNGVRLVGNRALYSMRLDKAYREFGMDVHREISPVRAGMERFVDFGKEFVGREALMDEKRRGLKSRIAVMKVEPGDGSPLQHEGVYRNGKIVGRVTSGGYSWHLRTDIALALLGNEEGVPGTTIEISVLGERRRAIVVGGPIYDPRNERIK